MTASSLNSAKPIGIVAELHGLSGGGVSSDCSISRKQDQARVEAVRIMSFNRLLALVLIMSVNWLTMSPAEATSVCTSSR